MLSILAGKMLNTMLEIAGCRTKAWDTVKFRRHIIDRAYVGDLQGRDIVVCGTVESHPKEGHATIQEFASRAVFEEVGGKMRIKSYMAWGGKTRPA